MHESQYYIMLTYNTLIQLMYTSVSGRDVRFLLNQRLTMSYNCNNLINTT